MSYLTVAKLIFHVFLGKKTAERIEKSVFFLLGDCVCNVRAFALKALSSIYNLETVEKQQIIKNSLSILQQDEDLEIRNMIILLF